MKTLTRVSKVNFRKMFGAEEQMGALECDVKDDDKISMHDETV